MVMVPHPATIIAPARVIREAMAKTSRAAPSERWRARSPNSSGSPWLTNGRCRWSASIASSWRSPRALPQQAADQCRAIREWPGHSRCKSTAPRLRRGPSKAIHSLRPTRCPAMATREAPSAGDGKRRARRGGRQRHRCPPSRSRRADRDQPKFRRRQADGRRAAWHRRRRNHRRSRRQWDRPRRDCSNARDPGPARLLADSGQDLVRQLQPRQSAYFAIDQKAQIINMSLSGPDDRLLRELLKVAMGKGETVVAAFDRTQPDGGFPASVPGVIAVSNSPCRLGGPRVYRARATTCRPPNPGDDGSWSTAVPLRRRMSAACSR